MAKLRVFPAISKEILTRACYKRKLFDSQGLGKEFGNIRINVYIEQMETQSKEFLLSEEQAPQQADEGIKRQLLGYNGQLMMAKITFRKGAVGTLHDHPHVQASYVASGRFKVIIGGKEQVLNEGDGFFVPSGVLHGCECLEEGTLVDVFTPMREDFI